MQLVELTYPFVQPVQAATGKFPDAEESYRVKFDLGNLDGKRGQTGSFVLEIQPKWAPLGAKRFKEMLCAGFFEDIRFFRVIGGFMAQVAQSSKTKTEKNL